MPHSKSTRKVKLGRKTDYRSLLLKNLATSLVLHEKITTTDAKAKLVKSYVDKLIAKAVGSKSHDRELHRYLNRYLLSKKASAKIVADIKPRMAGRNGGYVSSVQAGFRHGDGARISIVSILPGIPVAKKISTEENQSKGSLAEKAPKKSITGKEKVTVKRKKAKAAA